MISFEDIARATLKIECGIRSGSGFHFQKQDIVVTNFHVIELHISRGKKIFGKTDGVR